MESLAKRASCYVIAPLNAEVSSLLEAFRAQGFEPFYISDFLRRVDRRPSQIRTAFRSVNFVVALLSGNSPVNNVLFEIGVAVGLNKPVFLFSDGRFDLPIDLESVQIDVVDLNNHQEIVNRVAAKLALREEALSVGYDRAPARSTLERKSRHVDLRQLKDAIQDIRGVEAKLSEQELESRLTQAFTRAGLTVARAPRVKSRATNRPDLALWVDDVQKEIGNPIAIEIKRHLDANDIQDAIDQLSRNLIAVGASAGIVLHTNYDLLLENHLQQASPPIYVFSVSELLDLLGENRLGKVLKSPRRVFG